jgi:hypothetical protein
MNSNNVELKNESIDICDNPASLNEENEDQNDDLDDVLSDIEELIENAIDVDVSKYPEGASVRKKRVLEFRLADPFSILPNGWIEITHNSGLPVYLVSHSIWEYFLTLSKFSIDPVACVHLVVRIFWAKALYEDTMSLPHQYHVITCVKDRPKSKHRKSKRI